MDAEMMLQTAIYYHTGCKDEASLQCESFYDLLDGHIWRMSNHTGYKDKVWVHYGCEDAASKCHFRRISDHTCFKEKASTQYEPCYAVSFVTLTHILGHNCCSAGLAPTAVKHVYTYIIKSCIYIQLCTHNIHEIQIMYTLYTWNTISCIYTYTRYIPCHKLSTNGIISIPSLGECPGNAGKSRGARMADSRNMR